VTPLKVSIVATIASLLLLLVVFELIRSRRLRERYALLWLATGVVLLVLSTSLWHVYLTLIALSSVSSFFMPAQSVTIRSHVPREGLLSANALMQIAVMGIRIVGPAAAGLVPPPADLTAPALRGSSPLEFYRKINVGVAGTAMPAFSAQVGSDDRWALALYASGLRYGGAERERGERWLRERCPGCLMSVSGFTETLASSDDSLAAVLAGELGRTPDDSLVREAVAFARTAGAADVLGGDRRLRAARTVAPTAC